MSSLDVIHVLETSSIVREARPLLFELLLHICSLRGLRRLVTYHYNGLDEHLVLI